MRAAALEAAAIDPCTPPLNLYQEVNMSTMEVKVDLEKFTLREGDVSSKEGSSCKTYLQANKTRSTPTSPNCFRTQNLQTPSKPRHRESPIIRLALFPKLEKCISEPEVWNAEKIEEGGTNEGLVPSETTCSGSKSDGHISHMSEDQSDEKTDEESPEKAHDADDIEDATRKKSMLSESHSHSQPSVISLRPEPAPPCAGEALIVPRKLQNPCVESRDHQNLHRELLFNQKIGKNVLNQKSELQRALEKHKESQIKKELELQKQDCRSPFEKVIEERARRLESLEKSNIEEEPSNKPEFLQVHAKLRARMDSK